MKEAQIDTNNKQIPYLLVSKSNFVLFLYRCNASNAWNAQ